MSFKSCAALGLLLVLSIVVGAHPSGTIEPREWISSFGAPAHLFGVGGEDSTRVSPTASMKAPPQADLAQGNLSGGDPTVTFSTNGVAGISAIIDGANTSLPATLNWATGSQHSVSAAALAYLGAATREVFQGWTGSETSGSTQLAFVVNGDMQLTANYRAVYLETFEFLAADGLRVTPSSATITGTGGQVSVPPSGQVWLNARSNYSLSEVVWSNITVGPVDQSRSTIFNSAPKVYAIVLTIYRDTIKVVDVFGIPFRGVSVTLTSAGGSKIHLLTDANGVVSLEMPVGSYSAEALYFGVKVSLRDDSVGPHSATVSLPLNYPTILALFVTLGTYTDYLVRRKMKKRLKETAPFLVPESPRGP